MMSTQRFAQNKKIDQALEVIDIVTSGDFMQHIIQLKEDSKKHRVCVMGGNMYSVTHDTIFSILKRMIWHICKECSYEDAEEFKDSTCTA